VIFRFVLTLHLSQGDVIPSTGKRQDAFLYRTITEGEETLEIQVPIWVWEGGDGAGGYQIIHGDNIGKTPMHFERRHSLFQLIHTNRL